MKRPNLRRKGNALYLDLGGKPRHWIALGSDEAVALRRYDELTRKATPGTVDAMLGDYLAAPRAPLAPGTVRMYQVFRRHISGVFGHQRPTELSQATIIKYLRRCPRKSARGEMALLSMAFTAWIEDGRLEFNPCFGVHIKGLPKSKRDRLLTETEIDAIIAKADERLAVAIELAWSTGLRISDLCALRWADFVPTGVETRKTGVRQAIEVTDALGAILDRARALQARVGSLYVLCDRRGRRVNDDTLRGQWQRACEAAGVANAQFRDLRASGGTEVDRRGGDAQKFLGHRSRATTEVYLRDKRANVVRPLKRKG